MVDCMNAAQKSYNLTSCLDLLPKKTLLAIQSQLNNTYTWVSETEIVDLTGSLMVVAMRACQQLYILHGLVFKGSVFQDLTYR